MKMPGIVVLSIVVIAGAIAVTLTTTDLGTTVHEWTHEKGLCQGERCLNSSSARFTPGSYTSDEIVMVRSITDRIIERGTIDLTLDDIRAVEEQTGLDLQVLAESGLTEERIQAGVLAEMQRREFDISSIGCAVQCARFNACSMDRDLSDASGAELARYEREKSEDGQTFENFSAPDFSLPNTVGETIILSAYRGRHVVLAFLSGHCHHCLKTLPVLDRIQSEDYAGNLVVLPVYVNSGSVDDVRSWSTGMGLDLQLLVSGDGGTDSFLSGSYGFRMVPSLFLIDEHGMIERKLVGQKSEAAMKAALAEFAAS